MKENDVLTRIKYLFVTKITNWRAFIGNGFHLSTFIKLAYIFIRIKINLTVNNSLPKKNIVHTIFKVLIFLKTYSTLESILGIVVAQWKK